MRIIGAIIGLAIMGACCFMVWRLASSFFNSGKADTGDDPPVIKTKQSEPEKKDPKTGLDD